jgi:hypothetical protein
MINGKIRRLATIIGAAALLMTGVATSASAGTPDHHPMPHRGTEHFLLLSTNATSNDEVIVGTGPIHARGTDHRINDNLDLVTFPRGCFKIWHNADYDRNTQDNVTGLFQLLERGDWRIVSHSGTGAFVHLSGHGTYTLNITAVGTNPHQPPLVFELAINASGNVQF